MKLLRILPLATLAFLTSCATPEDATPEASKSRAATPAETDVVVSKKYVVEQCEAVNGTALKKVIVQSKDDKLFIAAIAPSCPEKGAEVHISHVHYYDGHMLNGGIEFYAIAAIKETDSDPDKQQPQR